MTQDPGPRERSDRDLVLAFQAGDRAAYDELYKRHRDRVAGVCYRFLHNATDVEEAAQETFLKAFQALPRFNGQYQVGAWLARIAANVCVDHLRVRARSHLVALPSEDRIIVLDRGPEEILVGNEPRLDEAIKELAPVHADALRMRGVDGLSHVEIAGRLQMTPAQVKALLHRARSSFKRAWDKAQGWLLAPVLGARSVDRSAQVSNATSNMAVLSAHAPALAEKAAASVVVVMVALSGPLATPTQNAATPISPDTIAVAPARDDRNRRQEESALAARPPAADAAASEEADLVDTALALPDTITSSVEGREKVETDDDETTPPDGHDTMIPPGVRETPKQAREDVVEALETVRH